tara:strand:+ start:1523 stop:2122 length:600 start_codon:yes stop_codon:yes gene_type:complete
MRHPTLKADAIKYAGWASKAITGYKYVFRKYLATLNPLEMGDFWQLQHGFARDILLHGWQVSAAATALFDRAIEQDFPEGDVSYTYVDALRFVTSWRTYEARAYYFLEATDLPRSYAPGLVLADSSTWDRLVESRFVDQKNIDNHLAEYAHRVYDNTFAPTLMIKGEPGVIGDMLEGAARAAFIHKNTPQTDSEKDLPV